MDWGASAGGSKHFEDRQICRRSKTWWLLNYLAGTCAFCSWRSCTIEYAPRWRSGESREIDLGKALILLGGIFRNMAPPTENP